MPLLQENTVGNSLDTIPPPRSFSARETISSGSRNTLLGQAALAADMANLIADELKAKPPEKQPDKTQAPVVFSKSESIPLGLSNKILRKAAWGMGFLSFILTGISGIKNDTPLRTASGFGSAAITGASLFMKEKKAPLPDTSIPGQMWHSYMKPGENTLFFNRSATLITDILKLGAGIQSGRRKEIREGLLKVAIKTIDITGSNDQDKREKLALKGIHVESSALRKIFANRWTSLAMSFGAGIYQIQQGIENKDNNMLKSGIMYIACVACLAADNAIVESKIKEADHAGRGR